jgi:hypothetical protein
MRDQIVEQVVQKYQERSAVGIRKYGTTLEQNNKDNYLKHLQEELMDATLYLEKKLSLEKQLTDLVNTYPNNAELGEAVRNLVR